MLRVLSAGLLLLAPAAADHVWFAHGGARTDFEALLAASRGADVILFGELHDSPEAHRLQLALARALPAADTVFGGEMLETDGQLIVDEYLADRIRLKDLLAEAKVWANHETDYQPILDLAKEAGRPFIATNIPRRYAALVARDGLPALDTLSDAAKRLMAPLPIPFDLSLPGYQAMLAMVAGSDHAEVRGERLAQAQAVKDATMAWSILRALPETGRFLHLNGSYHSQNREGIVWYLRRARPELKVVTIATVRQADLAACAEENRELADFVLVVKATEEP